MRIKSAADSDLNSIEATFQKRARAGFFGTVTLVVKG